MDVKRIGRDGDRSRLLLKGSCVYVREMNKGLKNEWIGESDVPVLRLHCMHEKDRSGYG